MNNKITQKEYDKAMQEMECWSVENHYNNCEKCQKKFSKAFGGCLTCYGKGYSTELVGKTIASGDFIGQKDKVLSKGGVKIHFCSCNRGKQLEKLLK